MASQDAGIFKFEAYFKQYQSEMTNKIDTLSKVVNDRVTGALPSDKVKNSKFNVNHAYSTPSAHCKKAKIAVGEGITRSIFEVKEINFGEENIPYWTTVGKCESYMPCTSMDGIGARPPYYAKKDFTDHHLPKEWEITMDAKLNPFKVILVFRKMVEFLGTIHINLKGNMWVAEESIENKMDWNKPPKGDSAWHIRIKLIDPDGERFDKAF
ncbi:hypothetical protein Tco_1322426 [Tanacetum coccineum]